MNSPAEVEKRRMNSPAEEKHRMNSPAKTEKAPQGLISGRGIVESAGDEEGAEGVESLNR